MIVARRQWNNISKEPEEKIYQPKILLLVKISLQDEGERKPFLKEENRICHQQTSSPNTRKKNFFRLKGKAEKRKR